MSTMITKKHLTIALIAVLGILSIQTVALVRLSVRISQTDFSNISAGADFVDFTDNGSAPGMVGGC